MHSNPDLARKYGGFMQQHGTVHGAIRELTKPRYDPGLFDGDTQELATLSEIGYDGQNTTEDRAKFGKKVLGQENLWEPFGNPDLATYRGNL
jgi:hypothetical protein